MSEQKKAKIIFIKKGEKTRFWADVGQNLREAIIEAGNSPYTAITRNLNCGGNGICATCGVFILKNEPKPLHWHDKLAYSFGYPRLSCQITISEEMTILFPDKKIWGSPKKESDIPNLG